MEEIFEYEQPWDMDIEGNPILRGRRAAVAERVLDYADVGHHSVGESSGGLPTVTIIDDEDYITASATEKSPLLSHSLNIYQDKRSLQNYLNDVAKLNSAIDDFASSIQGLSLFKFYATDNNKKVSAQVLHERFNARSVVCSEKVLEVQRRVNKLNHDNHYVLVHRDKLHFTYSDLRTRFNMQDKAVKRIKTLLETYNSVVTEYADIMRAELEEKANGKVVAGPDVSAVSDASKTLCRNGVIAGNANGEGTVVVMGTQDQAATILDEIKSRSEDIQMLEKNARDLNKLFADLHTAIKKRGENINSLEKQILLSSEQIDKGRDDMDAVLCRFTSLEGMYVTFALLAVGTTCFLVFPSQLKSLIFGSK